MEQGSRFPVDSPFDSSPIISTLHRTLAVIHPLGRFIQRVASHEMETCRANGDSSFDPISIVRYASWELGRREDEPVDV